VNNLKKSLKSPAQMLGDSVARAFLQAGAIYSTVQYIGRRKTETQYVQGNIGKKIGKDEILRRK
jgi:hypothetical protein